MLFDKQPMKQKQVDQEVVWSAIRYLDPDERDHDREARSATLVAVLALLLIAFVVWGALWLRVQGL